MKKTTLAALLTASALFGSTAYAQAIQVNYIDHLRQINTGWDSTGLEITLPYSGGAFSVNVDTTQTSGHVVTLEQSDSANTLFTTLWLDKDGESQSAYSVKWNVPQECEHHAILQNGDTVTIEGTISYLNNQYVVNMTSCNVTGK